jgi:hypothetical protein
MADMKEKMEVIAHLGDHITYKEDIGICYDSALAKVIEDAYMTLKNGVTLDNQVSSSKWISVKDRLPENFVSVLGYMTDAGDFPPVRECYTVGNAFFFPALGDIHPVSHWCEMPEPPKGE